MKHLTSVVAAVDFSKPYRICQWDEATLASLYVVDRGGKLASQGPWRQKPIALDAVAKMIQAAAKDRVEQFVKDALGTGATVKSKSVIG